MFYLLFSNKNNSFTQCKNMAGGGCTFKASTEGVEGFDVSYFA